jgi:hypothetical protein
LDAPPLPPPPAYVAAPTDLYPRGKREQELCAKASQPDWLYMGGLLAIDVAAIGVGSSGAVKDSGDWPIRYLAGPTLIGLAWGATVGGMWLAAPKCEPHWIGETPREGRVRATWPLAISLALLGGATAPIVNAIAIGYNLPLDWSTEEREVHIILAGVAGFAGALLPYALPPRTYSAALELDHLRFGYDGRAGFLGWSGTF